jgi:class 3 adenylate cyclase
MQRRKQAGAEVLLGLRSRLPIACPACGFANDAGDEFCGGCGGRLTAGNRDLDIAGQRGAPIQAERRQPRPAYEAERRQLTVMFCDLVDSTALSARLDPEQLREVMRTFQSTCEDVIARFDGYVAQYLGDGLLVYFGHPQAHEDDAQRAVRAGLSILSAMTQLNARPDAPPEARLSIRVGIHTGLVVVSEVGGRQRHERLALGETPNLAFHVQALAEPDTLAISGATLRLVRGLVVSDDLGQHALRGVAAPLHIYRVLGESGARSSRRPLVVDHEAIVDVAEEFNGLAVARVAAGMLIPARLRCQRVRRSPGWCRC